VDERLIDNGDITLRVEVTGDGPTVVCVPGWPDLGEEHDRPAGVTAPVIGLPTIEHRARQLRGHPALG
jgi:hypothetical protein